MGPIKESWPYLMAVFIYLLVYIFFRIKFGTHYAGDIPQKHLDILAALKVIKQFVFQSIPGYLLLSPKYRYLLGIYNNSLYGFSRCEGYFERDSDAWLVKAILVFYVCFDVLKKKIDVNKDLMFLVSFISLLYFFFTTVFTFTYSSLSRFCIEIEPIGYADNIFFIFGLGIIFIFYVYFYKKLFKK